MQRDQVDTTVQVLLQISQQLAAFALNPAFANSTSTPATLPSFTPSSNSVWVNALWFTALLLSLITASLGMLIKQWYREHLAVKHVAPRERCRLRQFRYEGLRYYKVSEIASFLPILLQLALILFFAGLVVFVRAVHASIGWLVVILVAIWFLSLIITTFIPMFSPSCPYKTPFLKALFVQIRASIASVFKTLKGPTRQPWESDNTWRRHIPWLTKLPTKFREEDDISRDATSDVDLLLKVYDSFKDVDIWEMVTRCVDLSSPSVAIETLSAMVKHKFPSPIRPWTSLIGCYEQSELHFLIKSMAASIRKAFLHASDDGGHFKLQDTDAAALVTLARLTRSFRPESDTDRALSEMVDILARESLSIPRSSDDYRVECILSFPSAIPPTDVNFICKCRPQLLFVLGFTHSIDQ